jgi:hypothetical protein
MVRMAGTTSTTHFKPVGAGARSTIKKDIRLTVNGIANVSHHQGRQKPWRSLKSAGRAGALADGIVTEIESTRIGT